MKKHVASDKESFENEVAEEEKDEGGRRHRKKRMRRRSLLRIPLLLAKEMLLS